MTHIQQNQINNNFNTLFQPGRHSLDWLPPAGTLLPGEQLLRVQEPANPRLGPHQERKNFRHDPGPNPGRPGHRRRRHLPAGGGRALPEADLRGQVQGRGPLQRHQDRLQGILQHHV